MNVTHDMIYGYTDSIILRFLSAGDNYGYEINRSIAQKSKGRLALKEATLYTALRRLEKDGLITSYWGTDDKSGGPRRRYYAITQAGRERLEQRLREWAEMRELMEMLLA